MPLEQARIYHETDMALAALDDESNEADDGTAVDQTKLKLASLICLAEGDCKHMEKFNASREAIEVDGDTSCLQMGYKPLPVICSSLLAVP